MECRFCLQDSNEQPEFLCTACARNSIYVPRLEYTRLLLEKSTLSKQIEEATSIRASGSAWQQELSRVDEVEIKRRLENFKHKHLLVQEETRRLRECISDLKQRVSKRRAALQKITRAVRPAREAVLTQLSQAQTSQNRTAQQLQHKSAINRAFLCREVAALMRLKQRKRQRNGSVREMSSLSGLILPDLREINNMKCVELTAVLQNVAHLVTIAAFYLGVRLPAEIVLPGKGHPQTLINTPACSYLGERKDTPEEMKSRSGSPPATRYDLRNLTGPRPLHCGTNDEAERLSQLVKRDTLAFNLFIEGAALLAWNVAWLNRSQGISAGTNTWEEICNIGKNLHRLMYTTAQTPSTTRNASVRESSNKEVLRTKTLPSTQDVKRAASGMLGQGSHLAAYDNLDGSEFTRSLQVWQYSTFTRISSSLRNALLNEMNNAEWELLQEQEWDDGGEDFDQAVMIRTRNADTRRYEDARSAMNMKTITDESDAGSGRVPGTSGWTKLKSRDRS